MYICFYLLESGEQATGPCIGDSGAGFFIKLDGAYYLRGIASAISANNGTCDLSNKYSVFCDVAKYMNWVKTAMAWYPYSIEINVIFWTNLRL